MYITLGIITAISALGLILTCKQSIPHRILTTLLAFGAGSMLAIALVHIFPEAIAHSPYGALAFL